MHYFETVKSQTLRLRNTSLSAFKLYLWSALLKTH